jgi:hypothetical protein
LTESGLLVNRVRFRAGAMGSVASDTEDSNTEARWPELLPAHEDLAANVR